MPGEEIPQLQHSRKFVEKENPAIMRQAPVIAGDSYVSGRMSHVEDNFTKSEVILNI